MKPKRIKENFLKKITKNFKNIITNIITLNNKCNYKENCIWSDYETDQHTGIHRENFIVAHYFDGTKLYFKPNEEFCKWLISKEHEGYTAIAHSAKG